MFHHAELKSYFKTQAPTWSIGFRPFFLSGALFSALLILLWVGVFTGRIPLALSPLWHGHEMLFGFGPAILAGFLLTATQNWTGKRGVHGIQLQLLLGVWFIGRLAMLLSGPWTVGAAFFDLLFVPVLLWALVPYLFQPGQKRNRVIALMLGILGSANLLYHLGQVGLGAELSRRGLYLALHLYLLLILLIGGRVIPAFSRNALKELTIQSWPWLEKSIFVLAALWLLSELFWPQTRWTAILAVGLGLLNLMRLWGWKPWRAYAQPILWILPLSYLWLIVGLAVRGLWGHSPAFTHLLTMGAMGGVMFAMMTRVGLGHTGRPLRVSKAIVLAYGLLQVAIALRVLVPAFWPDWYLSAIGLSGVLWVGVFGLYLWEYWPILTSPRPDGKEA